MNFKLGRNAPCWCNSGKKYKLCHLNRDREVVASKSEVIDQLHRSFSRRYCLHPLASRDVCRGGIVQAHSIQRSGGLNRIARDGHVYRFTGDLPNLIRSSGQLEPELIGVKKASTFTFTGFCEYHDDVTFASLEKAPFEPTVEQIFQLSYRPICRELFTKQSVLSLMPFLHTLDRGRDSRHSISYPRVRKSLTGRPRSGYCRY